MSDSKKVRIKKEKRKKKKKKKRDSKHGGDSMHKTVSVDSLGDQEAT